MTLVEGGWLYDIGLGGGQDHAQERWRLRKAAEHRYSYKSGQLRIILLR
jgi:hypothetical protein